MLYYFFFMKIYGTGTLLVASTSEANGANLRGDVNENPHDTLPPAKALFFTKIVAISLISQRKRVLGTHEKRLNKALLMSTQNTCFH